MNQQELETRIQDHKTSALVAVTGFDQSSINRWKKGGKMTTAVLAMWRFFFELEELKADKKTLIEALGIKSADNS